MAMRHKHSEMMLNYWTKLRGATSGAPKREDVSPREFKRALPDVFLIERLDRSHYVFRLAGTRVCAIYGRELRDHNFVSLWPVASQGLIKDILDRALNATTPALLSARAETLDKRAAAIEILLMPLADENGQVTRLLGSFVAVDPLPAFSEFRIAVQTLERAALIDAAAKAGGALGNDDKDGGMKGGTRKDPFLSGTPTKVSYLRVVATRGDTTQFEVLYGEGEALGSRLMRMVHGITHFSRRADEYSHDQSGDGRVA